MRSPVTSYAVLRRCISEISSSPPTSSTSSRPSDLTHPTECLFAIDGWHGTPRVGLNQVVMMLLSTLDIVGSTISRVKRSVARLFAKFYFEGVRAGSTLLPGDTWTRFQIVLSKVPLCEVTEELSCRTYVCPNLVPLKSS